jgi:predicted RNase H-like HicB family nuclease
MGTGYQVQVSIGRQEDGLWRVEVPDLHGCWVDAPTLAQALSEIQEVIAMVIDYSNEQGWSRPSSVALLTAEPRVCPAPCHPQRTWPESEGFSPAPREVIARLTYGDLRRRLGRFDVVFIRPGARHDLYGVPGTQLYSSIPHIEARSRREPCTVSFETSTSRWTMSGESERVSLARNDSTPPLPP